MGLLHDLHTRAHYETLCNHHLIRENTIFTSFSVEFPIGAFRCLQTNTALPQLCNISRVSAETSRRKAQCIFAFILHG